MMQSDHDTCKGKGTEVLLEGKEKLCEIMDDIGAGYFLLDRYGQYHLVNHAFLRMHGYTSHDEVIGKHYAVTQLESSREAVHSCVEQVLSGDLISSCELGRRSRNGSIGYHSLSAIPAIRDGEVVGLEGFLIDITERKRLEEEKETLCIISNIFSNTSTLGSMCQETTRALSARLRMPIVSIELCHEGAGNLVSAGSFGIPALRNGQEHALLYQSMSERVVRSAQPLWVTDASLRTEFKSGALQWLSIETFVSVPMRTRNQVLGTLTLADQRKRLDLFEAKNTVQGIADHLAQQIEQKQALEAPLKTDDKSENRLRQQTRTIAEVDEELQSEISQRKRLEQAIHNFIGHPQMSSVPLYKIDLKNQKA